MPEEWEGLNELRVFFGWRRAAEIIGTCVILAMQGKTADDIIQSSPSQPTEWRLYNDLRRFREELERKGKGYLLQGDDPVEALVELMRTGKAA